MKNFQKLEFNGQNFNLELSHSEKTDIWWKNRILRFGEKIQKLKFDGEKI